MNRRVSVFATILLATMGTFASMGWAQEARGTIVGRVTDASGAAVPAATVTVTSQSMGTTQTSETNETGLYQATYLIPGLYTVEVSSAGFKKYVRKDVELRIGDRIDLPVTLEVGAAEQSVTVVGETPLLNTASASMGQVIDSRRVADLPVPHGNPMFLIGLTSGVSFNRDQRLDRPFEPTHIVGYSMDGTRANRSDITIDGSVATATAGNGEVTASFVPPADVVQEFKVQTATFDAQFGQTEGGVTNISIKSGTNDFHGTAYYNTMVPSMFANDFFANLNGVPLPDFTYNRYGGSLGGPVRIPGLYNGQNKTFFMYGFEGIKEDRPRNNGVPTVPTARMKQGDFSELLALGPQYQIYNPFSAREVTVNGSRVIERDPFPGNIIPANLISPVAKNILGFYPDPLQGGTQNNYQRPELTEHADYGSHTLRVDQTITDNNRMFGRINWYDRDSTYNNYFNNVATGNLFQFVSRAAVIDDVHTLSPTTVLNVRYGYNRFIRGDSGAYQSIGFDLASLGFPAYMNSLTSDDIRKFPRIEFNPNAYQNTSGGGEWRPNDTHNVNAIVSKSQGAHMLRFGTEFRSYRENRREFGNNVTGTFTFATNWTRGPLSTSPEAPNGYGQSIASLLLGLPTGGGIARPASYSEQSTAWGFFFQDDWKVSPKLTLNLGLRWEFETPLEERYNRSIAGFDPNATLPFGAQAQAAYAANPVAERPASQFLVRGGVTFPSGEDGGLYETPKLNLMPRFGFAYQFTPETVFRGGYGIFYGFLGQRRGDVQQLGFSRTTDFQFTQNGYLSPSATLSNPLPSGELFPTFGSQLGPETGIDGNVTFFNQNPKMPYMQRWQMGVQRQLPANFVVELSYVGNRGTRLEINRNINAISNQYLSTDPVPTPAMAANNTYLGGNLPNPFRGLTPVAAPNLNTGANRSRSALLRPFPQFGDLTTTTNQGYSWYHSMQAQFERRFSQGFTIQGSYTWSKFMEAGAYLNAADPMPYETISDFDVPHRFVASGIWEMPFGKGKAFGTDMGGVANAIIGGWQLGAIYTNQSGTPLAWGNIPFNGDYSAIKIDDPTRERWFNTEAGFVKTGQLQSNVRYFPFRFTQLRAMGVNNWDASLIKNTRFGERGYNFQFKAEFLNALNRAQLPAPNLDPRNAQFGQINASTQANYPRRIQLTAKFIF